MQVLWGRSSPAPPCTVIVAGVQGRDHHLRGAVGGHCGWSLLVQLQIG